LEGTGYQFESFTKALGKLNDVKLGSELWDRVFDPNFGDELDFLNRPEKLIPILQMFYPMMK